MTDDTAPSSADSDQVSDSKRRDRELDRLEVADFRAVMETKAGRRFIARLLEEAGVYRTSMTGNAWTYFNEGARNLGLKVLDKVNSHTPDLYPVMMRDFNEVRRKVREP